MGRHHDTRATMDIDDVLKVWSPMRLAEVLGTTIQNVSLWRSSGRIPKSREYEIQVKSGGRLRASDYDPQRDYLCDAHRDRRCRP